LTTSTWHSRIRVMSIRDYWQKPRISWRSSRTHYLGLLDRITFSRASRGSWWGLRSSKIWL
jgi:hypothetical protein